jgi:hypothetical protein
MGSKSETEVPAMRAFLTTMLLVTAALAPSAVAWGQDASPPRIVSVQQKGGLPEGCRILKTWTTERGQQAHLLEKIDSEEWLTVVQTTPLKPGSSQVTAQIYRWGNRRQPPEGSPVPPPEPTLHPVVHVSESPEPQGTPMPLTGADIPSNPGCAVSICGNDGPHCCHVYHYERPPRVQFRPGACQPIGTPNCVPSFGYYPTQWSRWPGAALPGMKMEGPLEPGRPQEMQPATETTLPAGL